MKLAEVVQPPDTTPDKCRANFFALRQHRFGTFPNGSLIDKYVLNNGADMTLNVINLGGIVTAIHIPDRYGCSASVVLGFRDLSDYVTGDSHFDSIFERYANRIARGRLTLNGQSYALPLKDRNNRLQAARSASCPAG